MDAIHDAQLKKARKGIIIGLLTLITSPDYDPTVEPAEFAKLIDEVTAIPGYDFLKMVTALHHEQATGLPFKRDLQAELCDLVYAMFGMTPSEGKEGDSDQRFIGKHPGLGAPYGGNVSTKDIDTSFKAMLKHLADHGYVLSTEKEAELRALTENVVLTGEPQRFDVQEGVAVMVGSNTQAGLDKLKGAVEEQAKAGYAPYSGDSFGLLARLLASRRL